MSADNYLTGLNYVWQYQYDSPKQGYHVTPGDPGGGTKGGVIETTWAAAVERGLVTGLLIHATDDQLSLVLRQEFWGAACDALPSGVDFLLFNGRMMTGEYPHLFQSCLGFTGDDVDGDIGKETLDAAAGVDPFTFIEALTGLHYRYLSALQAWHEFEGGWTTRLKGAEKAAVKLIKPSEMKRTLKD